MGNDSGGRVRTLRTASGISQADLAASVGVSKSYLSHIEAGRRPISATLAQRLAETLGIDVEQLTTGTPADAHEDLRLKLAFAELSLRNGDRDLAAREFAVVSSGRASCHETGSSTRRRGAWPGRRRRPVTSSRRSCPTRRCSRPVPAELGRSRVRVSIDLVLAYCECGDVARAVDIGEQALAALAGLEPTARGQPPGGAASGPWRAATSSVATSREPSSSPTGPDVGRARTAHPGRARPRRGTPRSSPSAPRFRRARAEHADRRWPCTPRSTTRATSPCCEWCRPALRCVSPSRTRPAAACGTSSEAMDDLREVGSRVDFGYAPQIGRGPT